MGAPVITARNTPAGFKMPDGYQTLITLANNPGIQIWEETVKSPGWDGGDKINTTTMHNVQFRTYAAKKLKTLSDWQAVAMYDPDVWTGLQQETNLEQSITITFPSHDKMAFWGYMNKAEIGEHKEGEPPLITVSGVCTNWDPVNFVEAGPVYQAAPGT